MKQKKLEKKVRTLFEEQGFEMREENSRLIAQRDGEKLVLNVFSSEKFTPGDIIESELEGKIFVDEELSEIKDEVKRPVSVIRGEEESEEYELPSYELIGEIAVINELTVEEEEGVEGILEDHPAVKTVLLKEEPLQGEYRVGEYRKLYGEETETVHKEYGCRFKVDPTKVYYSERFSTERKRVVDQIEDGEKVLVMFAGVGPFAIMAAKLSNPEKVVAVEKNPDAAEYLKENIELNDVEDVVKGYEGDVREIVPELDEKFDRIVMPLPKKANEFLDLAIESLDQNSKIHLYMFLEEREESKELLEDSVDARFEVSNIVESGVRSPAESRYCLDVSILEN